MDNFDNDNGISDLAWTMFATNGNPGFYMLYKDLQNISDEEDERLR